MPDGPSRPLWPGIATAEAPRPATSSGMCPALCDASTTIGTSAAAARCTIASIGSSAPVTLEAWVATARHQLLAERGAPLVEVDLAGVPVGAHDLERAATDLLEMAERPHHGVVLERGRHDAPALGSEPEDRQVERLGRVLGEDHLVGRLGADQVGEPLACEAHPARRLDRAPVAGAAGVAARVREELLNRLQHRRRLRPRRGRVVEVDVVT